MNPAIKIVVAVLVVAMIAVVGLLMIQRDATPPTPPAATAAPEATQAPRETAAPEASEAPAEPGDTQAAASGASNEAQPDEAGDAQGTMYEGALAGLTEDEIAALAMAEENSAERADETTGVEDPVD